MERRGGAARQGARHLAPRPRRVRPAGAEGQGRPGAGQRRRRDLLPQRRWWPGLAGGRGPGLGGRAAVARRRRQGVRRRQAVRGLRDHGAAGVEAARVRRRRVRVTQDDHGLRVLSWAGIDLSLYTTIMY